MKIIREILRGVVIGVANIIPGVSGGTMMVSMGIYDTLIHCITHLFKEFKKSVKTLLPYAVGMLIGILALDLRRGTKVQVVTEGADERQAMEGVCALLKG